MSFKSGDFYVTCPITGFQHYRSEMKMRWDGVLVHKDQWNPEQPQDKIRIRPEKVPHNTGIGEPPIQTSDYAYTPETYGI